MVGMKSREKEEITAVTKKSKTFGAFSTITTKPERMKKKQRKKQQITKMNEIWKGKQLQWSWET